MEGDHPDASGSLPLVGRSGELATLDRTLVDLTAGSVALEIVGEPGVGKTRLLSELGALAEERSQLVLSGRAIELERDLPLGPFIDALGDYLAARDEAPLRRLTADERAELRHVFPQLSGTATETPDGLVDERFRTHRAVRSLLEALALEKPLVLCLDDLHWADDASVETLDYLMRRPPKGPVLLALALRPNQAPRRLLAALASAELEGICEALEVGPLDRKQAAPLLERLPDPDARDAVFSESGGNPFYLEQLLRAGRPAIERHEEVAPLPDADLPKAVYAALAAELEKLPSAADDLLRAAAVLGEPFEADLAATIAELPDRAWPSALDVLIGRDLVRATEAPRRLRFRHPIVRSVVYRSTPPGWRLAAHARAAEVLARRGVRAIELARHVELSAAPGDEKALSILVAAAKAAGERGPASAAHWYRATLELLSPDDPRRLELLIAMAMSLGSAGELHEGSRVVEEALELLPAEASMQRVGLIAFQSGIDRQLGRYAEAQRRNIEAREHLGSDASPESVSLLIELATHGAFTTDWESACEWGERGLAAAHTLGDPPLLASALAVLCLAKAELGRTEEAQRLRSDASAVLEGLSDEEFATRLDAPLSLGFADFFLERYEEAASCLARGIEVSRIAGQGQFIATMRSGQAWTLCALGRVEEAESVVDAAMEGARLQGNPQGLAWALWTRAWVDHMAGELGDALRLAERSVSMCAGLEPSAITAAAHAHLAAICVEAGLPERALDQLDEAGAPEFSAFEPGRRPIWGEVAITAMLDLGRHDDAAAWGDHIDPFIGHPQLSVASGVARRARARILLDAAEPAAAAELALAGADEQEKHAARIEAARSRIVAGRALAAMGERERAAPQLESALRNLEECGSDRWAAEARRELRAQGRRVPSPGRGAAGAPSSNALSRRELEIAQLVSEGFTNREVANRLFISPKTVESHLSRIFEKLDVSRRAQLGAALERDTAKLAMRGG